ncbi:hypothetical protein AVEN_46610-1 [Araneus ventricosus]|uniref:Peptidase S1 domain-containing protein n=1 Tax=Araneus ventricosus TaxID=182803 RepID=A0A4Y2TV57_ARAVE|nr:hypothetical protein AVEN_46610-1 [Araneus ventricosus]
MSMNSLKDCGILRILVILVIILAKSSSSVVTEVQGSYIPIECVREGKSCDLGAHMIDAPRMIHLTLPSKWFRTIGLKCAGALVVGKPYITANACR